MFDKVNEKNESSSKKRLIHNAFFSSLSWILPLLLGFIATPIVVKGLGYEEYGLFSLILGLISYSFTFGIGRAVTKYVSEYRSQFKTTEINEIISVTLWFSLILGIAATIFIVLGAETIVIDVLQIGNKNHVTAIKALYLACATISFLMVGQVFQAIIQALHRFDRNSLLIGINGVLLTLGNIALVLGGFRLNALLAWNLLVTILNCLLFFHSAKKLLPEFRLTFQIRSRIINLIFKYGTGIIGYQIFGNILLIFERAWIIRKLGAENLTFYVVPMALAIYMHGLINSLILVVFPAFSELRDDAEKLLNLYRKATKIIFALVVFLAFNLICANKIFLKVWIDEEFSEKSYQILTVHVLTFSVIAVLTVIWQLAEGSGHPRFNAFISFIWLAVALPLMILTIEQLQNYGVAVSRLIGVVVTIPMVFYGERLFLGNVQWKFWGEMILLVIPAAAAAAFVEYQIFNLFAGNILTMISGGLTAAVIYSSILWRGNFFNSLEIGIGRRISDNL